MGDETVLRTRAREAMKRGTLPQDPPERMWGGPGSGASCDVCARPTGQDEVEFELEFASAGGTGTTNYHVHARCFAAWELERRNGHSNGSSRHSLPQADNEVIMPDRERSTTNDGERG